MLNIPNNLKKIYKKDSIHKDLLLYFPQINLTIGNEHMQQESMYLTESLCANQELVFGGCDAAEIRVMVADIQQDLNELAMVVSQVLEENNETYTMPLGTYIVKSCKRQADRRFKEITAYDMMISTDIDVSGWYNSLTFPIKVVDFRVGLYQYLNLSYVEQQLANDDIFIQKTVEPTVMIGRDVLRAIGEINATFGHITRENQFKYIDLGNLGLYPSETLYPSEDLYPSEATEYMGNASYRSIQYEDYIVESIDSIQIRQEEGETGVVVGETTKNPYVIQGNFLVFGMAGTELGNVARNILKKVKNKFYRPHTSVIQGLPYLEVGDTVGIATSNDMIESFIFKRTLSGIQALKDEISAEGNQKRKNEVTRGTEIEQVKGKLLVIKKSVDGVSVELSDLEKETNSKFEQTDEYITTQVSDLREQTNSKIEQTASSIRTEVSNVAKQANSKIEQTADAIRTEVASVATQTNSKIDQTAQSIRMEVQNADAGLASMIQQLAGEIMLKVSQGDMESAINIAIAGITLTAAKIKLEGYVSINNGFSVGMDGNLTINQGNIKITTASEDTSRIELNYNNRTMRLSPTAIKFLIDGEGLIIQKSDIRFTNGSSRIQQNTIYSEELACYRLILNGRRVTSIPYSTVDIIWDDNGNDNVIFGGTGLRGASTSWVLANFQRSSSSDFRLKKEIHSADERLVELLKRLKVKMYRFKDSTEDEKIHVGILAQQAISAMNELGIEESAYGIVEEYDTRRYKDEGMYTRNQRAYRVNYEELSNILILGWQKQQEKIEKMEAELSEIKEMLKERGVVQSGNLE